MKLRDLEEVFADYKRIIIPWGGCKRMYPANMKDLGKSTGSVIYWKKVTRGVCAKLLMEED